MVSKKNENVKPAFSQELTEYLCLAYLKYAFGETRTPFGKLSACGSTLYLDLRRASSATEVLADPARIIVMRRPA